MTLVVGVDFSRASRKALDWALAHAIRTDDDIVLAHAFTGPHKALGVRDGHLDPLGAVEAEIELSDARELTQNWAESCRRADVDVDVVAETADPAALILKLAHDHDASGIVISTRGRGGFKRALLGSVATKVVSEAHCPVTVVPAKEETE